MNLGKAMARVIIPRRPVLTACSEKPSCAPTVASSSCASPSCQPSWKPSAVPSWDPSASPISAPSVSPSQRDA